jgi:Novel STAND NTPase 3/Restriction endonuclease
VATLDALSDVDFELFVADLLGRELGVRFEISSRGPDGGVDLLATEADGIVHVVQCKHYLHSSMADLVRAARHEQTTLAASGQRIDKYTFVTSRRLSRGGREKLRDVLAPFTSSTADVLGAADLDLLLKRHPQVELEHVKLWLSGSGPLDRLLNAGTYERTHALLHEIRAALPRYVQTSSFWTALDILRCQGVCVISGPPGVGKTTLGNLLLLSSAQEGYRPFEIGRDVDEAWRLYREDEPQVFIFDDFLGRTTLFESVSDDIRSLRRFISHIARDASSRFVLTTREYVWRQATRQSEEFNLHGFDAQRYLLQLEAYSARERALILYNHVYFSPLLGPAARASLSHKNGYERVVTHPAYNPRLVEWLTVLQRPTPEQEANFADHCVHVLENPSMLWTHAFERGLEDAGRVAIWSLAGMPTWTPDEELMGAMEHGLASRGLQSDLRTIQDTLRTLDGSFVRSRMTLDGRMTFALINPSLLDFLSQRVESHPGDARDGLDAARDFAQVAWLCDRLVGGGAADTMARAIVRVVDGAATSASSDGRATGQLAAVCAWCAVDDDLRERLTDWLDGKITACAYDVTLTGLVLDRHIQLIAAAPAAGVDPRPLVVSVKAELLNRSYWGAHFEQLLDLADACPWSLSADERAGLLTAFAAAEREVFDDPARQLQDEKDAVRFAEVTARVRDESAEEVLARLRRRINRRIQLRNLSEVKNDFLQRIHQADALYMEGLFARLMPERENENTDREP